MTSLESIDLIDAILQALLNSLWQGFAVAACAGGALKLLRNCNAATRYAAWCATLLALATLPWFSLSSSYWNARAIDWITSLTSSSGFHQASGPFARPLREVGPDVSRGRSESAGRWLPATAFRQPMLKLPARARLFLFSCWLTVAALMSLRLIGSYCRLQRLKRRAKPLQSAFCNSKIRAVSFPKITRSVSLGLSRDIFVPLAAGLARPLVLVPEAAASRLTESELHQVLLHELSHLRRWDDWTKLLQKAVEALFFFNPVVWWIGKHLNLEREIACDDWVVSLTGGRRPYAACLTKLVEMTASLRAPVLASGGAAGKRQLSRRIEMLLNENRNATPQIARSASILLSVLVTACALFFATLSPLIAIGHQSSQSGVPSKKSSVQGPAEEKRQAPASQAAAPAAPAAVQDKQVGAKAEKSATDSRSAEVLGRQKEEQVRKEIEQLIARRQEIEKMMREIIEPKRLELEKVIEERLRPLEQELEKAARDAQAQAGAAQERIEREVEELSRKLLEPRQREIKELMQRIQPQIRGLEKAIREIQETRMQEFERRLREQLRELEKQRRQL